MDGFAYAGEALTGKYFGANNKIGFDKVYRSLFAWGAIMALTFTLVYALGGHRFYYCLQMNVMSWRLHKTIFGGLCLFL